MLSLLEDHVPRPASVKQAQTWAEVCADHARGIYDSYPGGFFVKFILLVIVILVALFVLFKFVLPAMRNR